MMITVGSGFPLFAPPPQSSGLLACLPEHCTHSMHTSSEHASMVNNDSSSSFLHALIRTAPASVVTSVLKPAFDGPIAASLLNLHPPSINVERSEGPLVIESHCGFTKLAKYPHCPQLASPSSSLNIIEEAQSPLPTPCRALSYGGTYGYPSLFIKY